MKKLNEIQQKLKAPKNQYNSFGKYKYRNQEDILEAVKPLLGESTIIIEDEIVNIGERYYVKATVTLREGDESVTATAYAREAEIKKGMDESQITGATSSYARKYALNGLFLIDDTKDADNNDNNDNSNADTEKIMAGISKIASIPELKEYYEKHKGTGKQFASAVTERKKEIENSEIPVVTV
jgi:hypothetical protein